MVKISNSRMKARLAKVDYILRVGTTTRDKALLLAIKNGNFQKIKLILKRIKDINKIFYYGLTPLLFAFYCDSSEEIISLLIDAGADVNVCDFDNIYPLMYAFYHPSRNRQIVSRLIQAGADLSVRDTFKNTPLMVALSCKIGQSFVPELICAGSDVNAENMFYKTPLLLALENNSNKIIIDKLIENGANVNYDSSTLTPLNSAVIRTSRTEIIVSLINAGGNVNKHDRCGRSPLSCVICTNCDKNYCCNEEYIKILLENGADITSANASGNTLLHLSDCEYLINLLVVKYGLSVNVKNFRGETPLLKALLDSKFCKARTLLSLGADYTLLDNQLNNPLHCLRDSCLEVLADEFIYLGIDFMAVNNLGQTPLDLIFDSAFQYLDDQNCPLVKSILKHCVLFFGENNIYRNSYSGTGKQFINCYMNECANELQKIKYSFIKGSMSFYDFCKLKKTKQCKLVKISFNEYNYTYKQIKSLFPIYSDIILMRIKDNKIKICHNELVKNLGRLIFYPISVRFDEFNVCDAFQLNYYILLHISKYLSHRDLHNLILASF